MANPVFHKTLGSEVNTGSAVVSDGGSGNIIPGIKTRPESSKPIPNPTVDSTFLLHTYTSVFAASHDAIILFDTQQHILSWNPAAEKLFGYTSAEAIGQSITIALSTKEQPGWEHTLHRLLSGETIQEYEIGYTQSSQANCWLSLNLAPVQNSKGDTLAFCAIAKDITQEINTKEKLKQQELLLRESEAIARVGSMVYDFENDELRWSDQMYRVHGFEPGAFDTSFKNLLRYTHPGDRKMLRSNYRRALFKRQPVSLVRRFNGPDGRMRYIKVEAKVIENCNKKLLLIGTACDITHTILSEQECKDRNSEQEKTNRELLNEIKERKKITAALIESEEKWRTLVQNTPDIIARFNPEMELIFVSDSVFPETGLKAKNILGKHVDQIGVPETAYLPVIENVKAVFRTGKQMHNYISLDTPTGVKHFYLIAVPEFGANGRIKTVLTLSRNITDAKLKENMLNSVLDSSIHGIIAIKSIRDAKNQITDFEWVHVNKMAEQLLKHPASNLIGKTVLHILPGNKTSGLFDQFVHTINTGETLNQVLYYDHDHLKAWYQIVAVKLDDGLVVTFADITHLKETEYQANLEKKLSENLIEYSTDGISAFDKNGTYFAWNKTLEEFTAIRSEEALGRNIFEVFPHIINTEIGAKFEQVLSGKRAKLRNLPFRSRAGYWDANLVPTFDKDKQLTGGLCIVHDITESLKLKELTMTQELTKQKEVMNAILFTQETERKRIAEALHNGLGQLLYAAKLYLEQISYEADNNNPIATNEVKTLLEEAIKETRTISHELMPIILEDFGLRVALGELCSKFSGAGVNVQLVTYDVPDQLEKSMEMAAYRIIQELVNNVIKHAGATVAEIEVFFKGQKLYFSVCDNGKGIDKAKDYMLHGIGLRSIQNRLKLLNGELSIDTCAGKGTCALVEIDMAASAMQAS
ncbi:PAS domain S-box protein [Pontibacter vulgaris]|uniref:PAS domain S-box protein n=1 Tax=Pontibacter vulgaris TaxID=2905679 RepID=UPI001FA70CA9|nr:PAS domain S-box protein [Pontibacter vulgaris]